MNKDRASVAQQTLTILEIGTYNVNGNTVNINWEITQSRIGTRLYQPDDERLNLDLPEPCFQTDFEVLNETTIQGIQAMPTRGENKTGVLNFASAKNPGGGFLGGAQAQEETLARSSSLYNSLMECQEMYAYNRGRRSYLYSDYLIHSKDVVFFRDDSMDLLEIPLLVDVITAPAPNLGAIRSNKPSEESDLEATIMRRMDKVLASFYMNGCTDLILGAWGCGVFRNDPVLMANCFAHYLKTGGKYNGAFRTVRFSVLDSRNNGTFEAFRRAF